jgi:peptidoglycan hydrolase-like protein with peptidoglycan-binding domain
MAEPTKVSRSHAVNKATPKKTQAPAKAGAAKELRSVGFEEGSARVSASAKHAADPVLRRGSSGAAVFRLQGRLEAHGVETGPVDGDFGPLTHKAVKTFQRHHGLDDDGEVGPLTWAALKAEPDKQGGSPGGGPGKSGGLKVGSKGPAVEEVQRLLKAKGYDPGPVDSEFGPRTRAAVMEFQGDRDLEVDGVVGPLTLAALRKDGGEKPKKPKEPADEAELRAKILEMARGQIGTLETGTNGGPCKKYQSYFGRGPEPWCADFVSWIYTHAGKNMDMAYCPYIVKYLRRRGAGRRTTRSLAT